MANYKKHFLPAVMLVALLTSHSISAATIDLKTVIIPLDATVSNSLTSSSSKENLN